MNTKTFSLVRRQVLSGTPWDFLFWAFLCPSGQRCMSQNVAVLPQKHSAPWIIRLILNKYMSGFMSKIRGFVLVWSVALANNNLPFTDFQQTRASPIVHGSQECLWLVLLSNITFLVLALLSHKTCCFFCCNHEYEQLPHPPFPTLGI